MKTWWIAIFLLVVVMATPTPADVLGPKSPPCMFVENRGQWDASTKFLACGGAVTARIERNALALDLPRGAGATPDRVNLRFVFEGAAPGATVVGEDPSRAVTNFLVGSDPARWRRGVPSYHRVICRDLYAGVDVQVREHAGRLKYDVLVEPGADLAAVVIRCEGATALGLAADGALEVETAAGTLRQALPVTWQELPSGGRMTVACRYQLLGGERYGFAVPDRDPELPLVIDPQIVVPGLEWSTFFGTAGVDAAWAVAVGSGGQVIAAGFTDSAVFPTTAGAYDAAFNGGTWDAWVACFDPAQSGDAQLLWCTYLGGGGDDFVFDVARDPADGSVLVAGLTSSSNFPTPNGYDQSYNGSGTYPDDGFVARLSPDGSELVCATYLGATEEDWAVNVDPGAAAGVTVSGYTNSASFPTTPEAYDPTHNGNYDVFVTRFDPSLSSLVFSTFLGGSGVEVIANAFPTYPDIAIGGLAVSASGAATVCGLTRSTDFPDTPDAYQTELRGTQDAFVARLSPEGSALEFATYFGGSSGDGSADLAIRPSGEIAISGWTTSEDLPTTAGAYDRSFNGPVSFIDGFVACFDPAGSQLRYSTFLGGIEDDQLFAIACDALGDVVVSGCTGVGFPVTADAYDPTYNGGGDVCLARLRPFGSGAADLKYGTYLGGSARDVAWGLAVPEAGFLLDPAVLGGSTRSADFPTTPDPFDSGHNGSVDGWVGVLGAVGPADARELPLVGPAPASLRLGAPYPNPSAGAIEFAIDLSTRARVRVGIYDLSGRLVTELLDREVSPGTHVLSWEPERLRGLVPPGTYFVRLAASGRTESRRVVIGL